MDLIIKPTEKCNFRCTFCSSTKIANKKTDQLDLQYIYDFLKRYPETRTIIVNGGDPLMIDPSYYFEIINHLNDHHYEATISLTTNLWPFYKNPQKWLPLFKNKRVYVCTSFQYGGGRLKGDYSEFTEQDFWAVSDMMLELVGYRPDFISVIVDENEHLAIKNVELAKQMGVVCKLNYAMASGDQGYPYQLSKIYKTYVEIYKAGLMQWEYNTKQMATRLVGMSTTCPQNRRCDEGIRAFNPLGDYYSCGAFGDDKEYSIDFEAEKSGQFITPLQNDIDIMTLKVSCFTCPMFEICNGCRKTIKDMKKAGIVEQHCKLMKQIAPDILEINGLDRNKVTPYVQEYV